MKSAKVILFTAGLVVILLVLCLYRSTHSEKGNPVQTNVSAQPGVFLAITNIPTNTPIVVRQRPKIKRRVSELTSDEKSKFLVNFETRYKPALSAWCKAYEGHVPFSPESVTADKFVERVGKNELYREYIFVVDGITLGIWDKRGTARVDYMNDPRQTRKMATLPDGTEAPIATSPITRDELMKMLAADGGLHIPANEVRMIPSGFSGSLNGGVLAHVGGNPENAASWDYDLVFGPDGKLAYYLKGQ
jgi:hypothetical protein